MRLPIRKSDHRSRLIMNLVVWVAVSFALAAWATTAAAHAFMVKSEPKADVLLGTAPDNVVVWFSQELDSRNSTIQIFDNAGRQVDTGDGGVDLYDPDHLSMMASLPETLPNGTYIVRWAVVSIEDDDPTEGEFTFSVGKREAIIAQDSAARSDFVFGLNQMPFGWIAASLGVLAVVLLGSRLSPWSRSGDNGQGN